MAASAGGCPSTDQLRELLGEELADGDRTAVEAHVETCIVCQGQLERLVAPTAVLTRPPTLFLDGPPVAELDLEFLQQLRHIPVPAPEAGRAAVDERGPSQVGPYEILGRLGVGGMGTVYRARHHDLDRVVALKVLSADRVDEAAVARFRNEMKAAGRLDHPNIVAARDAGRVGGTYYLAMDFVDGADLSALIGRLGPLLVADACELVRQAAVGLQHAHEAGVLHRDIKPSNLMLTRGGVVKVLDLGLARAAADIPAAERLTASGVLIGTADYIAPEQIDRAHAADARADVYGLGGTLYFLLTGSAPYGDRGTWWEKLRAHADAPVPAVRDRRPGVPAPLSDLIGRMLAKSPADRPATPGEVAAALAPFAVGADASGLFTRADATPPTLISLPTDTRRPAGRRGWGETARYAVAVAVGAAVVLAASPFLWHGQPPGPPSGGAPDARPAAAEGAVAAEGVRLTYGPHGPQRPDHRVLPGDQIDLEFVARGVGKGHENEEDLILAGELLDPTGKKVRDLPPPSVKTPLYRDGMVLTGAASSLLDHDQPPGEYRVRCRLIDKATNERVASFEHPLVVRSKEFGATRLRLTLDKEGKLPAGCHLTVGHQYYFHLLVENFEHKEGGIYATTKVSVRDRDGKDVLPAPIEPIGTHQAGVSDAFTYYDVHPGPLTAVKPGEVTILVEVEDKLGKRTVKYELPAVIHPPRSLTRRPFGKD
jgi:hypothetical protein